METSLLCCHGYVLYRHHICLCKYFTSINLRPTFLFPFVFYMFRTCVCVCLRSLLSMRTSVEQRRLQLHVFSSNEYNLAFCLGKKLQVRSIFVTCILLFFFISFHTFVYNFVVFFFLKKYFHIKHVTCYFENSVKHQSCLSYNRSKWRKK